MEQDRQPVTLHEYDGDGEERSFGHEEERSFGHEEVWKD